MWNIHIPHAAATRVVETYRDVPKTFLDTLELEVKRRERNILRRSTRCVKAGERDVYWGSNIWRKNVSTWGIGEVEPVSWTDTPSHRGRRLLGWVSLHSGARMLSVCDMDMLLVMDSKHVLILVDVVISHPVNREKKTKWKVSWFGARKYWTRFKACKEYPSVFEGAVSCIYPSR